MKITSINHIELTVTNLLVSKKFYEKLPGFKVVAEYPNFMMFSCANFKLGLTDHSGKTNTTSFSEFNVGMDHVCFALSSQDDLLEAVQFLEIEQIPHGDIKALSNGAKVLAFRDPDNIQLEFIYREE